MTNIFCGSKYFVQLTKDTRNEGISTVRINPINLNRQLSKTKKLERFKNLQPSGHGIWPYMLLSAFRIAHD